MEQHPVPRNITGFQFKLIGDMTLQQFGYLAGGGVLGYVLFKLLPFPFIINVSIGGLVFFIGFAFAFLPFQDRPLDQWLVAFIKSVYSPTQFIYQKDNQPPDILIQTPQIAKSKVTAYHQQQFINSKKLLEAYLAKLPRRSSDTFDQNEKIALAKTLSLFAVSQAKTSPLSSAKSSPSKQSGFSSSPPPIMPNPPILNKPSPKSKEEKEETQTHQLSEELKKIRQQIKLGYEKNMINPDLEKRFLELEQKLTTLLTEREKLTTELAKLRQKETSQTKTVTPQPVEEPPSEPGAKIISQPQAAKVGFLNLPSSPNLVVGVVMDTNRNSLSNILITVKDLSGTPLRALKTNQLGQFFASTPLPNGVYVLEVEDPRKNYFFDLVEIKLTGEVVQPIEIIAKKRHDPIRERLSKELFQKPFS